MTDADRTDRERFQARLLDAVGEAVIATDLEGTILYWNAAAEHLYGWPAEEVLGRDVAEVTPTDMFLTQAREIMDALRTGESWSGEFMVKDRQGREFPVLVHDSPILDKDGKLVGIIGTSTEITRRKRSEERQEFLARAGEQLTATLEVGATMRTILDLAVPTLGDWGYVLLESTNGAGSADKPEGLASDERAARAMEQVLEMSPELRRIGAEAGVAKQLGNGSPELLDRLQSHQVLAAPLVARGHTAGLLFFGLRDPDRSYDMGDRELAMELARRAAFAVDNARLYHRAQEANRAKADFLAVVSHELRTPLNAITGYTDLLETGVAGELSEKQAKFLGRIRVGARHLTAIIDEILAFARVKGGQEAVELGLTNLALTVEEAATVVAPGAEARGLELRLDLPEKGPEILTDQGKIRQILVNLLGNAVRYTEQGRVEVTIEEAGDDMAITVRDTGIGIPESDLDEIFEPFWQSESPNTRKSGGTGLGLSISRHYARILGGDLTVRSDPGVGSEFVLRLPVEPPGELR